MLFLLVSICIMGQIYNDHFLIPEVKAEYQKMTALNQPILDGDLYWSMAANYMGYVNIHSDTLSKHHAPDPSEIYHLLHQHRLKFPKVYYGHFLVHCIHCLTRTEYQAIRKDLRDELTVNTPNFLTTGQKI